MNHRILYFIACSLLASFILFSISEIYHFHIWRFHLWIDGIPILYPTDAMLDTSVAQTYSDIPKTNFFYWIPRYTLILPVFLTADLFNLERQTVFSLACLIMVTANSLILYYLLSEKLRKNEKIISKSIHTILFAVIFLQIWILATFMNGRLLFAFFGFATCILSQFQQEKLGIKKYFYLIFISFLFSSVSSGALLVTGVFWLASSWRKMMTNLKQKTVPSKDLLLG